MRSLERAINLNFEGEVAAAPTADLADARELQPERKGNEGRKQVGEPTKNSRCTLCKLQSLITKLVIRRKTTQPR